MSEQQRFAIGLIEHGFWIPTGVRGVFGRTEAFESVVNGIDQMVVDIANQQDAEKIYFPPVVDREIIRRTAYMESFPELCGSIHSFRTTRASHEKIVERAEQGGDWGEFLEQMPLTLCPAACYPVYPTCAGILPEGGRLFNLSSYVFRAEPSEDPARLQCFRMRENVRIADTTGVRTWREAWMSRAVELLARLGLRVALEVASDPFFGRGGRLLAANQVADAAKYEIMVPITSESEPTAIASFNLHGQKFSQIFDIRLPDGGFAHTACIGFGLERTSLALIKAHGFDLARWPATVRQALCL